ncbi:NAD synthetase [Geminocystis sp. GBBB08]|nr:NAD synthetase [Geminocystis sp. GBBB08]
METDRLDLILGMVALVILLGGLLMLFSGMKKMND